MAQPRLKMRLGDLLVQEQIISDDQLQLALQQQRQTGRKLGTTLIDLGFISEVQLLQFLARQLDVPFFDLNNLTIDASRCRCCRKCRRAAIARWRSISPTTR